MPVLKYHVNGFIEQLLFASSFTQHLALGIPPHFLKESGKCFPLHCFVFHCVNIPPLLTILLFGCLQFLIMINKGTVYSFLKGLNLGVETQTMLSPSIVYMLKYTRNFQFSKVVIPLYILVNNIRHFQLLYILTNIWYVSLSNFSHCVGCIVIAVLQWGDSPSLHQGLPLLL